MSGAGFWPSSGLELLERDADGRLVPTDAWLRSWLALPELELVPESCPQERRLHAAFAADPRLPVTPVTLLRIRDRDARENWELFVAFRDHVLAHGTIEEAYAAMFRGSAVPLAPPFVDRLARLVVHNILRDERDPFVLRAAELFFRPQRAAVREGRVLLADADTVARLGGGGAFGDLGALVRAAGADLAPVELEVLGEENAAQWFGRSERFDFVLDFGFGARGPDALCRVLERWIAHFFAVRTQIQPLARIRDEHWRWHIGLDAEASAILDDLYAGREVRDERLARLVCLFRLDFRDPEEVLPEVRGRPVYLALAMDGEGRVRLKPQNLLVNLPLQRAV